MAHITDLDGNPLTTAELHARVAAYYAGQDVPSVLDSNERRLCQEFTKRYRADKGALTVIEQVAAQFGATPAEIVGRERTSRLADARVVISWILRQRGYELEEIAAVLRRDHSTIVHHLKRVSRSWELKSMARETVSA